MSPYFFFIAVTCLTAQALGEEAAESSLLGLKKDHESMVAEMKVLLEEVVQAAKGELDGKVADLKTTLETANQDALQAIEAKYETSRRHIRSLDAPKHCLVAAVAKLEAGKTWVEFLKCKNLTEAGLDVLRMAARAGELVTELLIAGDDLLNGFSRCLTFNPISFIRCTITWGRRTIADFAKFFYDLIHFAGKIEALGKDIKAQFQFCMNESSETILQQTTEAMNYVLKCN